MLPSGVCPEPFVGPSSTSEQRLLDTERLSKALCPDRNEQVLTLYSMFYIGFYYPAASCSLADFTRGPHANSHHASNPRKTWHSFLLLSTRLSTPTTSSHGVLCIAYSYAPPQDLAVDLVRHGAAKLKPVGLCTLITSPGDSFS